MRQLPDEEKAKIYKLNEGFLLEKNRLISEVSKWDEAGNEIIVLAKRMCMIMMDMSDFTRYGRSTFEINKHCLNAKIVAWTLMITSLAYGGGNAFFQKRYLKYL